MHAYMTMCIHRYRHISHTYLSYLIPHYIATYKLYLQLYLKHFNHSRSQLVYKTRHPSGIYDSIGWSDDKAQVIDQESPRSSSRQLDLI